MCNNDGVVHFCFVQRGNFGEERYEKIDFQKKVREQFLKLKAEDDAKGELCWHVVDAAQSIEDVHNQIKQIVEKTVDEVANKPLNKLWV